MERQNPGELTPNAKLNQDSLELTGQKLSQKEALVQSKYELNENSSNNENTKEEQESAQRLDSIQAEIRQVARRLEQIQAEQRRQTDQTSDAFLDLQQERSNLRKRIIDLDYNHRVQCANNLRESRRRLNEERQKEIKEAEQQREKRNRQIEQQFNERKRKAEEELEKRKNKKQEEANQQREEGQEEPAKRDQNEGETELQRSRRQLRIAQIQAELAAESLRRSRRATLDAELAYLRTTYTYPYWSWRDYYHSPYSSLYSYPYYSYSSLYPSYVPYSASLLYPPYPYSYSYLSPYRYRWI